MKYRGYVFDSDGDVLGITELFKNREDASRALLELLSECEDEALVFDKRFSIHGELKEIDW